MAQSIPSHKGTQTLKDFIYQFYLNQSMPDKHSSFHRVCSIPREISHNVQRSVLLLINLSILDMQFIHL